MIMYTPLMLTFIIIIIIIICITSCDAFTVASHAHQHHPCKYKYKRSRSRSYIATQDQDASANIDPSTISANSPSSEASSLDLDYDTDTFRLEVEVCASSNIHPITELPHLLQLVSSTCTAEKYDGMFIPININIININIHSLNKVPDLTPGVLGRVLLININVNVHGDSSDGFNDEESPNINELVSQWKIDLSEQIDAEMYNQSQSGNIIKQPILLVFQVNTNANGGDKSTNNNTATTTSAAAEQLMRDAIENEISDYNLREVVNDVCLVTDDDDADDDNDEVSLDSLLSTDSSNTNSLGVGGCFIHPYQFEINCFPSSVIEIDGDTIDMVISSSSSSTMLAEYNNDNDGGRDTTEQQQQQKEGETEEKEEMHFDTSSVLVFDKLIDKSLRKRLLNVVKGYPEDHVTDNGDWNDIENGPDPSRWVRGGLADVMNDTNDDDTNDDDNDRGSSCWGLTNEAIMDMCYNDHPAIAEFESKLSMLFPDFVVSRLSEAVLGDCVSPLTANAPTHGDTFNYHIDCDPLQVPPSPWADVFGRYPNRNVGKPRFVSCLVYLNGEWDEKEWGAPTRFLDPPTEEVIEVHPKPGRCVIMDQDISHTVVAPNVEAGKRPRYSLVWKLVLHPTQDGQEMDLSSGRKSLWPEPIKIGSANQ